jgi:hypothetical protein
VLGFRRVWLGDTEFAPRTDGSIDPRCAVFLELYSGEPPLRLWEDDLRALKALPFDTRNDLFVCYSAGAEIGVFLELGLGQTQEQRIVAVFRFLELMLQLGNRIAHR